MVSFLPQLGFSRRPAPSAFFTDSAPIEHEAECEAHSRHRFALTARPADTRPVTRLPEVPSRDARPHDEFHHLPQLQQHQHTPPSVLSCMGVHAVHNPPSMTTLVASRQPLEFLSMNKQPERRTSKRLAGGSRREKGGVQSGGSADDGKAAADYERDDDFQFIRKPKRVKTEEEPEPPVKKPGRGRPAAQVRGAEASEAPGDAAIATATTSRRSSRRKLSVDASADERQIKLPKRATRRSARLSGDGAAEEPQTNGASRSNGRSKGKVSQPPVVVEESPPHNASVESAKIALPMSDTPIINRNKEMRRKGGTNRRSSLGSRGRRASSLIDSGQTAIPHREVNPAEFYKHIAAEGLVEPRRMKQLLTWCGERALPDKPSHGTPNSIAIHGARAIQDLILKDFASRSDFSDWFSREDADIPKAPVILQPNPRNTELDEKLVILEEKIKRLQEEKKAWLAMRKAPVEQPEPLFSDKETNLIELPDFDLLDTDDGEIRGFLADESFSFAAVQTKTEQRLRQIQSSLEFQVDQLADNIHKLEQRVAIAGKEADKVLHLSAQRLREREEREKKGAGTKDLPVMEVLRSLSRILPEGGG
ncbi:Kinetochore protein mis13 [Paramyrothecium foliicola]|nr:Kinetochore protein mis13 [Paramyrothecium foliicola]